MTTNYPDRLDSALIRPGRIDLQVAFTRATRAQLHRLFIRMYAPDHNGSPSSLKVLPRQPSPPSPVTAEPSQTLTGVTSTEGADTSREVLLVGAGTDKPEVPSTVLQRAYLEALAINFADALPEDTLTPAEVQGFLLQHKRDPERAVREVAAWRDRVLEAKAGKAKGEP